MDDTTSPDLATVRGCVERGLATAQRHPRHETDKGALHAARSRTFVGALGDELLGLYEGQADVRCFSKHDDSHRRKFGMNELLYDVTVCRTATVASARGNTKLHYIRAPLWHVESELAKNSRQALFDFNKLVLGAAPLNLFVGPLVSDPRDFLDVLRPAAACCLGRVFAALIPHPRDWNGGPGQVRCEEFGP